jgi:molybdate transport system regulatory protein
MPYKKAWMLLDSINRGFAERVATATPGGTRGGGAALTPFGAEVLERYQRLAKRAAEMATEDMRALGRKVRPDPV